MLNAKLLLDELSGQLSQLYGDDEASSIMKLVFREKLGISKIDLLVSPKYEIEEEQHDDILLAADKLLKGQPVQQVLGFADFYGYKIRVNKHVLIPRPETEELVKWIIEENTGPEYEVLDIGTGSGCIAIALALGMRNTEVTGIDISQHALELAQMNVIAHNATVDLVNMDILNRQNWKKLGYFEIIVSNPPYVTESEKVLMHTNVLDHEPHLALFVPDDNPLRFYLEICDVAQKHLTRGGRVYLEINEAYGTAVKELLTNKGFRDVVIQKDINDRDRFVRGTWG